MNIKNKNSSKRKDSNSRQHTSHLRSTSKSNEKAKHRSDSKLLLRLKQTDISQLNASEEGSKVAQTNALLSRPPTKKIGSGKPTETSNEYYNHYRIKSKSKGKLHPQEEEANKTKYLNSIYMHKESHDPNSTSHLEHSAKVLPQSETKTRRQDAEEPSTTNPNILNKIRLIEKNGAIDSNGKFVIKEVKPQQADSNKYVDSQQTISIYEDKKKDKLKKKEKPRKEVIKTKSRKDDKAMEIHKISGVRSADKFIKKKEVKEVSSPSILQKHPDRYFEAEPILNYQLPKEPPLPKPREIHRACHPVLSTRTSKTILSEETQTSPPQVMLETIEPSIQISIDTIMRELSEEITLKLNVGKLKLIFNGELTVERVRCIEFLSKICINMGIRREAHSLAVFYMDKYMLCLEKDVTSKQLKLISMTALLLALKVDDGIMSRKLCYEYLNHMDTILSMSKTNTKSKSIQKHKQAISSFSSKENSTTMNKSKSQSNISQLGLSKPDEGKKSRKQQIVHPKELSIILSLQLDMLLKFNFKLMNRSSTYWIDVLTLLWDEYIMQVSWEQEDLLFRRERNKRNLSHCYQLVQKLYLDLQVYTYSKPIIVLSVMYLIIRMRLQQQKQKLTEREIYTRYATNLSKSTNLIFYDKVGVNELFGDYLGDFDMNMSEIITCIQYVGRNLCDSLKVFSFNSRNKYINCKSYEHQLSIYETNSEIYRFYEEQN